MEAAQMHAGPNTTPAMKMLKAKCLCYVYLTAKVN